MSRVYVRWYGRVLEGELLEGEYLGKRLVRIPLDGHHPVALFAPDHVYETAEAAGTGMYPSKAPGDAIADMIRAHRELSAKESVGGFIQNMIDLQKAENFKAENWDHERNHMRIDCLEEFYRLWRDCHNRYYVGVDPAEAGGDSLVIARPQTITQGYSEITSPSQTITQPYCQAPVTLPPHSTKPVAEADVPKSSTPMARQKSHKPEKESVQLSLFN